MGRSAVPVFFPCRFHFLSSSSPTLFFFSNSFLLLQLFSFSSPTHFLFIFNSFCVCVCGECGGRGGQVDVAENLRKPWSSNAMASEWCQMTIRCSSCDQITIRCSSCDQMTIRCSSCDQMTIRCSSCDQMTIRCSSCDQMTIRCSSCDEHILAVTNMF